MEGESHGAPARRTPCEACQRLTDPGQLTFDAQGRQLCRRCYGQAQSAQATKRARKADEYRRCSKCAAVVRPEHQNYDGGGVITEDEDGEQALAIFTRRVYECDCGAVFKTWTWQALTVLSAGGLTGAYFAGAAWRAGEQTDAILWALLGSVMLLVLWDVHMRYRHPRVR